MANQHTVDLAEKAGIALAAYHEHGNFTKAAEAAGYGHRGSAYRAVMTLLANRAAANASELRAEQNERHAVKIAMLEDVIYDVDRPMAERLRAVDAHTRAEARHARLNGLDAPLQVAISAGVKADLDDALQELDTVLGTVVPLRPDQVDADAPALEA